MDTWFVTSFWKSVASSFLFRRPHKRDVVSLSPSFYQRWIMRAISSRWYDVSRREGENLVVKCNSSHAEYVDFTICLFERRGCCDAPRDHVSWNVTYVSRDAPKTTDERRQRESSRNRGTATAARGREWDKADARDALCQPERGYREEKEKGEGLQASLLPGDPRTEAKKM